MAARNRKTKRTSTRRIGRPVQRAVRRRRKGNSVIVNTVIPLALLVGIVSVLGFMLFMGIRTVAATSFFDTRKIEVEGINRVSESEVARIVRNNVAAEGILNTDLGQIKAEVEKLAFVKTAVVVRMLPDTIRVRVQERVPKAIVRLERGDFWADEEAELIAQPEKGETRPPFVLRGWDEARTPEARKANQDRVKAFSKLLAELQTLGIETRVNLANMADLSDVKVMIEDSGQPIVVSLGKEDFGARLKKALDVVEGKGASIESLVSHGSSVIAKFKELKTK